MDNFKAINDTFGHLEGDAVLSKLAIGLTKLFNASDIVGRLGGDEFFVFMTNCNNTAEVIHKAKEIGTLFKSNYSYNGKKFSVSSSVGIAMYPGQGKSFMHLYKNADEALYAAKHYGKNGYALFNDTGEFIFTNYKSIKTESNERTKS